MSHTIPPVTLNDQAICWQDIVQVARHNSPLELTDKVRSKLRNGRAIVEQIVKTQQKAYGITTGLGALCEVLLQPEELSQLSYNTVLSHACGVGDTLKVEQTRAIMCVAVVNYSKGTAGISPAIVELIVHLLNHQITPCVPKKGSVGYLTHMAHIGLTLIGIGDVDYAGRTMPAAEALALCGLAVVELGAKDGLSLVNGTPCATGISCLALDDCKRLAQWADVTAAMSFEALSGQKNAFDQEILSLKPFEGLQKVGENLRLLLADSSVIESRQGLRTQDALSIRAIPQIHGACRDQFKHAEQQINTELNSSSDNPMVLGTAENYRVISHAHPHGESMAMACDLMTIAVHELSSVAERRLDRLVNPLVSGLPPFLVKHSGVNSGMMIAQYVAASLVGENKILSQPSVVNNFVTSGLQEDHLSMSTPASLKLQEVLDNSFNVIAIEYLFGAQAFEFFTDETFGKGTQLAWRWLRQHIAPYHEDRWLAPEINLCSELIRQHKVNEVLQSLDGNIY